jgi:hypothetical protein
VKEYLIFIITKLKEAEAEEEMEVLVGRRLIWRRRLLVWREWNLNL